MKLSGTIVHICKIISTRFPTALLKPRPDTPPWPGGQTAPFPASTCGEACVCLGFCQVAGRGRARCCCHFRFWSLVVASVFGRFCCCCIRLIRRILYGGKALRVLGLGTAGGTVPSGAPRPRSWLKFRPTERGHLSRDGALA